MDLSDEESSATGEHVTAREDSPGESPNEQGAPRYDIPCRDLAAVEIPAVIQNVDRAVKAFGRGPSLQHTLDPLRMSIPFYINPESPFCKPVMSHNARSNNVVLMVTVPKRTGRKRKRGSDGPWQGDIEVSDAGGEAAPEAAPDTKVCSVARLDDPRILRRKLQDNVGKYEVEAVGTIRHTHRFRGLADFYWDMSKSPFAQRYVEQVLPGDVDQLKQFKFNPGVDKGPNVDVLPPPMFTHMTIPFNYHYSQNPYVRATEDGELINLTAVHQVGHFIGVDDPAPDGPQRQIDMTDPRTVDIIAQLEEAFEDRPVWTRRSLLNHLAGKLRNWNELKKYLNYVGYQFKGGPWRDAVIVYGVDPRSDPKYRIYQTLMFKLPKQRKAKAGQTWTSLRRVQMGPLKEYQDETSESHIFDGSTYHADGKVWQACDITDSLLKDLIDNAAVRPTWDATSGWYHGGLWAKVKAIMKTKLVGLQFGRRLTRHDFAATLRVRDTTPVKSGSTNFHLPLPNLHLTDDEMMALKGRLPSKRSNNNAYNIRIRDPGRDGNEATGSASTPAGGDEGNDTMNDYEDDVAYRSDEADSDSNSEGEDDDDDVERNDDDDDGDEEDEDDGFENLIDPALKEAVMDDEDDEGDGEAEEEDAYESE